MYAIRSYYVIAGVAVMQLAVAAGEMPAVVFEAPSFRVCFGDGCDAREAKGSDLDVVDFAGPLGKLPVKGHGGCEKTAVINPVAGLDGCYSYNFV